MKRNFLLLLIRVNQYFNDSLFKSDDFQNAKLEILVTFKTRKYVYYSGLFWTFLIFVL